MLQLLNERARRGGREEEGEGREGEGGRRDGGTEEGRDRERKTDSVC